MSFNGVWGDLFEKILSMYEERFARFRTDPQLGNSCCMLQKTLPVTFVEEKEKIRGEGGLQVFNHLNREFNGVRANSARDRGIS